MTMVSLGLVIVMTLISLMLPLSAPTAWSMYLGTSRVVIWDRTTFVSTTEIQVDQDNHALSFDDFVALSTRAQSEGREDLWMLWFGTEGYILLAVSKDGILVRERREVGHDLPDRLRDAVARPGL